MNVHPDDLSNWCRADVCSECHDDGCQHDCHAPVNARARATARQVSWWSFVSLFACFLVTSAVTYRLVDYAVTDALELPAQAVTLVLLVLYVFPTIERWFLSFWIEKRAERKTR